jgi:hydroxyacylglutathione hydrolase
MMLQTIKSEIVSHISYIVGSKNEAIVIDPRRDCQIYSDIAMKWGTQIKYIFETHRNEDYVIGSLELRNIIGAKVFHGPGLDWGYGEVVKDNQEYSVGSLKIRALHTPGHSPESMSFAIYDSESGDQAVIAFTGDLLFVGDVGRTDFLGPSMTPVMAGKMYNSIMTRLLPLGDGVIVCPAHGAGSVCGGKIKEREISTIGIEKATNPMLKLSREEFIAYKVAEKHQTPPYFKKMEEYNLKGPPILGALPNPRALKPSEFNKKAEESAFIVDVRSAVAFGGAHIKGSFSLPPSRLSNVGWVLTYDKPILLIAENPEALDFAVRNLLRLGFDKLEGYLAGGLETWYKEGLPISKVELITVKDLWKWVASKEKVTIVDVRRESEWTEGHIEGSTHIYLGHLEKNANKLPRYNGIIVICKTGNRSSFGASVLLRAGFERVYNCLGGIDAWSKSGFPLIK